MYLHPDPDTVRMVPWATDPTAQIIHDRCTKDGRPHELAPRNVLRRRLARYEGLGIAPVVAPEVEVFPGQRKTDNELVLQSPGGSSGGGDTAGRKVCIEGVTDVGPKPVLLDGVCGAGDMNDYNK